MQKPSLTDVIALLWLLATVGSLLAAVWTRDFRWLSSAIILGGIVAILLVMNNNIKEDE